MANDTFDDEFSTLNEPAPPQNLNLTTAIWHAHRAIAHAAKHDFFLSEKELAAFMKVKSEFPEDDEGSGMIAQSILKVGELFIRGEIALQQERWEDGIWNLKKAAMVENTLRYTEPPYWAQPVRHTLGAAYMRAGRYEEAEATYRKDLDIWKDNGWSLYGLSQALQAQGKQEEAGGVLTAFQGVWANADEPLLTTSCKCVKRLLD